MTRSAAEVQERVRRLTSGLFEAGSSSRTEVAAAVLWYSMLREFHSALGETGVANELVVYPDGPRGFDYPPVAWRDCFERMHARLGKHV